MLYEPITYACCIRILHEHILPTHPKGNVPLAVWLCSASHWGTHAFRTSAQTFSFDRDPFALPDGKSKVLATPKLTRWRDQALALSSLKNK